jgi:uncharacterized protein (DUF58 family)
MELSPDLWKKIRHIEIRSNRLVDQILSGQYMSLFKGSGLEFDEVRPYHEGDDERRIDWNVTARTGHLHVKRFVEERELSLVFVVDVSPSTYTGSRRQLRSDLVIEFVALMAFSALRNHDRVGLLMFDQGVELFIPPRKGRRHVLRLLRELVLRYQQPPGVHALTTRLDEALNYLNHVLHRRATVFLVSDFLEVGPLFPLRVTSRRHDCTAVLLQDPADIALPAVGLLEVLHPETGARQLLDLRRADVRAAYQQQSESHYLQVRDELKRMAIDQIVLRTDMASILPAMMAFYRLHYRKRH